MDDELAFVSGQDVVLGTWNNQPWNLWLRGYPDQAIQRSQEAGKLADRRETPYVLTHRFVFAGFLYMCLCDVDKVLEWSETNISISEKHGYPWPLTIGLMHKAWAVAQKGNKEEGLEMMLQGLEAFRAMGFRTWEQIWHAYMAEIYGQIGQPDEGMEIIEESLGIVDRTLHRMWAAELHRIKGELLPSGVKCLRERCGLFKVISKSLLS